MNERESTRGREWSGEKEIIVHGAREGGKEGERKGQEREISYCVASLILGFQKPQYLN